MKLSATVTVVPLMLGRSEGAELKDEFLRHGRCGEERDGSLPELELDRSNKSCLGCILSFAFEAMADSEYENIGQQKRCDIRIEDEAERR